MEPWTKPIFDIFLEYYTRVELDMMINTGKIEICPLAFMRGRTFKNAFIIADEMQNSSPNQMKMLTTRLGDNSRMVITGDLHQTDITKENGLYDFTTRLKKYNHTDMIKFVQLENKDIERSEIVKRVIEIYDYKTENSNSNSNTNLHTDLTNYTKIPVYVTPEYKTHNNNNNNDAALIPKQHVTTNYDLFYKQIAF